MELAGAVCPTVRTREECLALFRAGDQRRVTGATLLNERQDPMVPTAYRGISPYFVVL